MTYTIKLRRGLPADWTVANPVLAEGEFGYELGTRNAKIGDGTTPWNTLEYFIDENDRLPDATLLDDGKILLTFGGQWTIADVPETGGGSDPNAMLSAPAHLLYTYDTEEPVDPADGDLWTDPEDDPPDTYTDDLEATLVAGENIEINRIGDTLEIVSTAVGEATPDLTGANDLLLDGTVAEGSILPAGWSWLNQASGAAATAEEKDGTLFLYQPAGAFNYVKGIYRAYPAGFVSMTARIGWDMAANSGVQDVGLFLQDSATGRVMMFALRITDICYALRFTNPTTFSSETSIGYKVDSNFDGLLQLKRIAANNWEFSVGRRSGRLVPLFAAYDVSAWPANIDRIGIAWNQEGGARKLIAVDWVNFE